MIQTLKSRLDLPQAIFFDAMGTLFDLKTSVGDIYQQYAAQYGVVADPMLLNVAFRNSFSSAPPLAFKSQSTTIEQQEFAWWQEVVKSTFAELNLWEQFNDFAGFFAEIYQYFATKEPWYVFPDTVSSLQKWKNHGVQLGVISNFDSRLTEILEILELRRFFSSITISSRAGFAKPDQNIFEIALSKHQIQPQQAWHIGDNITADYQGAKNAGMKAFWLNRKSNSLNLENQLPNLISLG